MVDLVLHEKQAVALRSQATEILYGGAAGGGKSHLMRTAAILWCSVIPGLQVYLFRRTFPDLWKNHMEGPGSFIEMLSDWMEERWCDIHHGKHEISFWNGSKIFLCHCQHEKDRFNYQGADIHVLMMDELTHFTDTIYRFLRSRVRLGGLDVPDEYKGQFPKILCGSNPGGTGHNWVKHNFVDYAPALEIRQTPREEGGMYRQYIPAKLEDNPTLLENDPDYELRLSGLGDPALVKAMREGDWDIVAGGMFDDVWKREVHVIKPFDIPRTWHIDRSFDWGSTRPFSVGWWAESNGEEVEYPDGTKRSFPRGTVFRIAEWYGWNGTPNEGCKMLASDIAKGILEREMKMGIAGRVKPGPADSSIFDTQDGHSIAKSMEPVKWKAADKRPGSRKQGWERMRQMLTASMTFPMEEPGLFIFENCTQFIRTIPVLPRSETDSEDIDTKAEDHIADETRYRLWKKRATAGLAKTSGVY